jgi:RimJ/RimL family protein N-acetyltransferase
MKITVYGEDDIVLPWVAKRLNENNFNEDAVSLGVVQDGKLIAGVVFNMYTESSICIHVAAEPGKHWLSRDFLFRTFAYPFLQLKCNRVTGLVRADNFKAQKLNENLGFVKEGILRCAEKDGTDVILYGMLKDECRWLETKK